MIDFQSTKLNARANNNQNEYSQWYLKVIRERKETLLKAQLVILYTHTKKKCREISGNKNSFQNTKGTKCKLYFF